MCAYSKEVEIIKVNIIRSIIIIINIKWLPLVMCVYIEDGNIFLDNKSKQPLQSNTQTTNLINYKTIKFPAKTLI